LHIEICRELTILNSYFIAQAIGLAKRIEDKIRDSKPKQNCYPLHSHHHPATTSLIANTPKPNTFTPASAPIPIKRLSSSPMQERRALGLCYNCDEKFILDHKCTSSRFFTTFG